MEFFHRTSDSGATQLPALFCGEELAFALPSTICNKKESAPRPNLPKSMYRLCRLWA